MEAVAKHEFVATSNDELSFQKGDVLKIIEMAEDNNWFRAEKGGEEGWVPTNYISVAPHDWFVKKMSRSATEKMLLDKNSQGNFIHSDGAFVLRCSESSPGDFSLSVKFEDAVQHFKVLRDGSGKYFLWVVKFNSLNDLIKYHRTQSVSRTQVVCLRDRVTMKRVADYDYDGTDHQELTLKRGDLITVVDTTDPNWWEGEVRKGDKCCRGLFPLTYTSPCN